MNVFFSSRRRHTRWPRDWSSDVCSSDLFDLLELDGQPLVDLQLTERRARLEQLLDRRSTSIRLSETFEDGDALLEAAREQGLEGIIAKKADSPHLQGRRTRLWLKLKGTV